MVEALDCLLILALLGLVIVVIGLVVAGVSLKNHAAAGAKRLYGPPSERMKTITAMVKGIGQQEQVRAGRITKRVRSASDAVGVVTAEAQTAARIINESDLKASISRLQEVVTVAAALANIAQTVSQHKTSEASDSGASAKA